MTDDTKQKIEEQIKANKIMLYMKGTPDAPQCGFSAQTSAVLNSYDTPFESFDILTDDDIRAGIKEFSDWPTIPQLYVNGEFVGGCDIITEMHNAGDLGKILQP